MVSGAILISWRQKILERQIDYGAKLGQVVLSLARMELNNFYKNVTPVAEYFDQNGLLLSVSFCEFNLTSKKNIVDRVIESLKNQYTPQSSSKRKKSMRIIMNL